MLGGVVPETLSSHCSLDSLHRNTLTVLVDSSSHLYELKQLLLAGLEQQLLIACKSTSLRKITLKPGRWRDSPAATANPVLHDRRRICVDSPASSSGTSNFASLAKPSKRCPPASPIAGPMAKVFISRRRRNHPRPPVVRACASKTRDPRSRPASQSTVHRSRRPVDRLQRRDLQLSRTASRAIHPSTRLSMANQLRYGSPPAGLRPMERKLRRASQWDVRVCGLGRAEKFAFSCSRSDGTKAAVFRDTVLRNRPPRSGIRQ